MEKPTKQRGGARKGAGRPTATDKRQSVTIYLPSDILATIKPRRDKGQLIEQLLRDHFDKQAK